MEIQEILEKDKPILLDFFSEGCHPCELMRPILDEVEEFFGSKLEVMRLNIDQHTSIKRELGIRGVPTLMLFCKGTLKWRQSGVLPSQTIFNTLERCGL